jgi:hypothetical protein
MICTRCGVSAPALKTCRWRAGAKRVFALCDECHAGIAGAVWIVPGSAPCFGTCRGCGEWVSVRDLAERTGGGRQGAPSGICCHCAELR